MLTLFLINMFVLSSVSAQNKSALPKFTKFRVKTDVGKYVVVVVRKTPLVKVRRWILINSNRCRGIKLWKINIANECDLVKIHFIA